MHGGSSDALILGAARCRSYNDRYNSHRSGVLCAVVLRRQSTIKRDSRIMWYDSMQNAIKQTIIISEILDTRTRHLIQV